MNLEENEESKENTAEEANLPPKLPSIKTRKLLFNLAKENLGNEATQGLLRVFDTEYFVLKVFWLVCLLGCGSLCAYLVAQTLIGYLSFPVYTTMSIVHEIPTAFPKVTLCNSMIATTQYAYELIKEINEELNPNISIFNQSQMTNSEWHEVKEIFWNVSRVFSNKINSAAFSDVKRQKLVHHLESVLLICQFNGRNCSSSDFIWSWLPKYGNCYTFNGGTRINNYKNSLLPGENFGLQITAYVGYISNLNLFNNGYHSLVPFANSHGLSVLIENNTFSTGVNQNVLELNGGSVSLISMKRLFTSKLPQPYSDCDIDNSNPSGFDSPYFNLILNSPFQYSQDLCIIQCIQKQAIEMCNCSIPFYVDLYNVSCKNEAESNCARNLLYAVQIDSNNLNCVAQCPLECNSTEISYEITTKTFATKASVNFVQLKLFYDSLAFSSSTDTPSMDIVAILSNLGGTLGLFLGVCAFSLCEFVHVFVEGLCFVKIKLQKNA